MRHINFWNNISNLIKNDIDQDLDNKRIEEAISKINTVKLLSSFNVVFTDERLEQQIKKVSISIFPEAFRYKSVSGNIVFCDSMMWDYHGLTQQYLRSLMAMQYNILYIKTDVVDHPSRQIENELIKYPKSRIIKINKRNTNVDRIKLIYKSIISFRPELIFIHSFSIFDTIALSAISSSLRYRINFGNHLPWVGINCTDYLLDFDDWGYTVSVQKRNFPKERIFKLPFYPINSDIPFGGFPIEIKDDQVIMFSGGATYKIMDENDTFLNLVKDLLNNNSALVFLYAARDTNEYLLNFINNNNLQNRFILIGYRQDINEVFKHIDIFMQTYPLGGTLMEKYALMNKVPVLTYATSERVSFYSLIDDCQIHVQSDTYKKAYDKRIEFLNEAQRLIRDRAYREFIGAELHDYCVDPQSFTNELCKVLYDADAILTYTNKIQSIDYDKLSKEYNDNYASKVKTSILAVLSTYRFSTFIRFPSIIVKYPVQLFSVVCNQTLRRLSIKGKL